MRGHSSRTEDKDLPAVLATSAVEMFWRFECTLKVTAGPSTLEEIIKKCKISNQRAMA